MNWLNPDKSLREQGIEETAVLTLREKFFFDQNVDRNDPVQLSLLYVQVSHRMCNTTQTLSQLVSYATISIVKCESFHYTKVLLTYCYR